MGRLTGGDYLKVTNSVMEPGFDFIHTRKTTTIIVKVIYPEEICQIPMGDIHIGEVVVNIDRFNCNVAINMSI